MRTFACVLGEHLNPCDKPTMSELSSDRNQAKILIGALPKKGSDMRVIRGGVGLGMGLTPLLPPNFLVSNGATSYPHLLSPTARPQGFPPPTHPQRVFPPIGPTKAPSCPAKCPQTRGGHKKPLRGNKGQVGSGLGLMQKLGQSAHSATPLQPLAKNGPVEIFCPVHMMIIAAGTRWLLVD